MKIPFIDQNYRTQGEGAYSLKSEEVDRLDFDLDQVITLDFDIDVYQPTLFVIDSCQQPFDAVDTYRARIR